MPWWGWLIIGFGLMAAELLGIEAAYYLIFVGFAAILTGLAGLAGLELPIWGQWLLFSILAITSMVLFRRSLYDRFRGGLPAFGNSLIGAAVLPGEDVPPGGSCRVRLRGTTWSAENVGTSPIEGGQQARVVATDGTLLKITSVADPQVPLSSARAKDTRD